ncbi:hypothetical protein AAV94_07965 [Lampropedia cohaerens]|uniref:DUF4124 domain-containing protein n=2 Tax=Lampropedia cohaerens TaxID=1610491 RepID=A0A0U1PZF7_9BURK|nr:hypothetical protein AAV94_07965 [Lampropedia cohaerens]
MVAIALAGFSASALAQWQWIDGEGRKVFSDRPPPPTVPPHQILKAPRGAAQAVPSATYGPPPQVREDEEEAAGDNAVPAQADAPAQEQAQVQQRAAQEAEAAQRAELEKRNAEIEKRNAQARQANCRNARERLAQLQPGRRVSTVDAQGNVGFMDDATRAAEREQAQQAIRANCN